MKRALLLCTTLLVSCSSHRRDDHSVTHIHHYHGLAPDAVPQSRSGLAGLSTGSPQAVASERRGTVAVTTDEVPAEIRARSAYSIGGR